MFSSSTAQRQRAEMAPDVQRLHGVAPGPAPRASIACCVEAYALGRSRGPRRERDLRRARRQRAAHWRAGCTRASFSPATSHGCCGPAPNPAASPPASRGGASRVSIPALRSAWLSCCGVKNDGSGTCTTPARSGRSVDGHPCRSVVHQGGQHARTLRSQQPGGNRLVALQGRVGPAAPAVFERHRLRLRAGESLGRALMPHLPLRRAGAPGVAAPAATHRPAPPGRARSNCPRPQPDRPARPGLLLPAPAA